MSKLIVAAILWLAPQVGVKTATKYATHIDRETQRHGVDPMLVVAIIHVESSWNSRANSPTSDYGLMQVHVSPNSLPHLYLINAQGLLFDPATNIRHGVQIYAMWRKWHREKCRQKRRHWSWSHYQYGYLVRNLAWSHKVRDLYHSLSKRFGGEV